MAQSPCVKVCVIEPQTQQCHGCLRTLKEIAQWGSMGDEEHQKILLQLPARKEIFTAHVQETSA